jgi:hypothetical protein
VNVRDIAEHHGAEHARDGREPLQWFASDNYRRGYLLGYMRESVRVLATPDYRGLPPSLACML